MSSEAKPSQANIVCTIDKHKPYGPESINKTKCDNALNTRDRAINSLQSSEHRPLSRVCAGKECCTYFKMFFFHREYASNVIRHVDEKIKIRVVYFSSLLLLLLLLFNFTRIFTNRGKILWTFVLKRFFLYCGENMQY